MNNALQKDYDVGGGTADGDGEGGGGGGMNTQIEMVYLFMRRYNVLHIAN